jgi:hypothetical protein
MEPKMKEEGIIRKIDKYTNFLLPNKFKRIGLALYMLAFISYLAVVLFVEDVWYCCLFQNLAKMIAILGLLMIAISKEKIEDELIAKIRMQSYHYAVIGTVIVQFFISFFPLIFVLPFPAETLKITKSIDVSVLLYLLLIKVIIFQKLKKAYYEE